MTSAGFAPDGRRVLSCADDGTARIWRTGPPLWTAQGPWRIEPLSLHPAGQTLICPGESAVAHGVVDLDGDKLLTKLEGTIRGAVFSPAGDYIAAIDDRDQIVILDP